MNQESRVLTQGHDKWDERIMVREEPGVWGPGWGHACSCWNGGVRERVRGSQEFGGQGVRKVTYLGVRHVLVAKW